MNIIFDISSFNRLCINPDQQRTLTSEAHMELKSSADEQDSRRCFNSKILKLESGWRNSSVQV